jgi:hypothetical protein
VRRGCIESRAFGCDLPVGELEGPVGGTRRMKFASAAASSAMWKRFPSSTVDKSVV